jgi:hypothetical protein
LIDQLGLDCLYLLCSPDDAVVGTNGTFGGGLLNSRDRQYLLIDRQPRRPCGTDDLDGIDLRCR